MSDQAKPPIPPPATIVLSADRKFTGATQSEPRTKVIVLPPVRSSDVPLQTAPSSSDSVQSTQKGTPAAAPGDSWTSRSGRPLDVNGDVHQTSAPASSLALQVSRNSDGAALVVSVPSGRQMDVQNAAGQAAITVERNARTTKQLRRSKNRKKADLDQERGRFRHTIRLEPKVEQKLRVVAEILGIDLNAAIAVCVSVHHHRLTKTGGGDS